MFIKIKEVILSYITISKVHGVCTYVFKGFMYKLLIIIIYVNSSIVILLYIHINVN